MNFRSVTGTIMVIIPLALVSILVYAVMAFVGIGLKVNTLPMVALGAGIGVDYGIYLFSRMQEFLKRGHNVHYSYLAALRVTGAAIFFTGVTLAICVATWVFSPLKFQAEHRPLMLRLMLLGEHAGRDVVAAGARRLAAGRGGLVELRPPAQPLLVLDLALACEPPGAGGPARPCLLPYLRHQARALQSFLRAVPVHRGDSLPASDADAPRGQSRRPASTGDPRAREAALRASEVEAIWNRSSQAVATLLTL